MHTSIMFALSREQNKVLKNTFMTLSLTMITTIIGVFLGLETIQYTLDNPLTVFIFNKKIVHCALFTFLCFLI
jgi:hypothetical protein